jgi:PST family polysaccharide transporter
MCYRVKRIAKIRAIDWLLHPSQQLSQRTLNAIVWNFGARGFERIIGYARVIALARLLSPGDFGVMGIGLIAIAALETLTEPGFKEALIQKKGEVTGFLDTLWTTTLLRSLLMGAGLALAAPFIARFFEAPDARLVVQALGGVIVLRGFTNPGIIYFDKDLEFQKKTFSEVVQNVVEVATAIIAALILRNVWALVLGLVARYAARVALSYILHPYRPRLSLGGSKARELFRFGRWVYLDKVLVFLATEADSVILARLLGPVNLGFYQMAQRTSSMPLKEIPRTLAGVIFPVYSKLQDDIGRLKRSYLRICEGVNSIMLPLAVTIFLLSEDFTRLVLGERWLPAAPAMQILAISASVNALSGAGAPLFMGVGKPWLHFQVNLLRVIALAAAVYPFVRWFGLTGAAYAMLIASSASLTFSLSQAFGTLKLRPLEVARALVPGVSVSACIAVVVMGADRLIGPPDMPRFLALATLAFAAFVGMYVILWWRFKTGPLHGAVAAMRR